MFFIKLSIRNILKNKKHSLLIALPVWLSFLILLFASAVGNGIKHQIINQYKNFQSGDVAVLWENVKEYSKSDPSRIFFSKFDMQKKDENEKALSMLEKYLKSHQDEIKRIFRPIKSSGIIDNNMFVSYITIYGISREELNFLKSKKVIKLLNGYPLYDYQDTVYISRQTALDCDLGIGDSVVIDGKMVHGLVNSQVFIVSGIYDNYSDYDGIYVYMRREEAFDFFECNSNYFSLARIFLKNPVKSDVFADDLDHYLKKCSMVLQAESIYNTTDFYFKIAGFQKNVFAGFIILILFLIGLGLSSTIRLRIFQQLKEFGTVRAIGFSRFQCFMLIYLEILIICLISFLFASLFIIILILILHFTGIEIGRGAYSYIIGGSKIYPSLNIIDFIVSFFILLLFSIIIPFGPGLQCSIQKIMDLLNNKIKNDSIFFIVVKLISRRSNHDNL